MSGKLAVAAGCYLTAACLLHAQMPPILVAPGIQQERLIHNVRPVYPELAKQAHIQGTVRLAALIDEDGIIEQLRLISGHPFLVKAAFDAVKQWRYRPATYRGVPVAVVTEIDVPFSLAMGEPPPSDKADVIRVSFTGPRLTGPHRHFLLWEQ
jgi:TonB family protein